jgi:hypothetical protein
MPAGCLARHLSIASSILAVKLTIFLTGDVKSECDSSETRTADARDQSEDAQCEAHEGITDPWRRR